MPDWVEHNRRVSYDPKPPAGKKGERRELHAPGTFWEYNDVRINQFSLALLHVFRRPLPEVFLEEVLEPLGGGQGFRWEGYEDAFVRLPGDGRGPIQSVPGGTHWGGGVSISSRDQARVGQWMLDGGPDRDWVHRMRQPNKVAPFYGWLTWLNRDGRMYADASRASYFMFGAGGHMTWIDPDNALVVVVRWLDTTHNAEFVRRVMQALKA
jgi:CubicO group peptidase (beta-lactamase class C family)